MILLYLLVWFFKMVKGCNIVNVMSLQDEQCRWTRDFLVFTAYNRMQSKHKQTNSVLYRQKSFRWNTAFSVGITILNQKSFTKMISKSSLNYHVYWKTLYTRNAQLRCNRELCTTTVQSVWEQYKQTQSFHNRR